MTDEQPFVNEKLFIQPIKVDKKMTRMKIGAPFAWTVVNWCAATSVRKYSTRIVIYRTLVRCPMKVKHGNVCCVLIWLSYPLVWVRFMLRQRIPALKVKFVRRTRRWKTGQWPIVKWIENNSENLFGVVLPVRTEPTYPRIGAYIKYCVLRNYNQVSGAL